MHIHEAKVRIRIVKTRMMKSRKLHFYLKLIFYNDDKIPSDIPTKCFDRVLLSYILVIRESLIS